MKIRILAAVVLLPLLLVFLLVLPPICTAILVGVMAAVGSYELLWGTGLVKHYRLIAYTAIMALLVALWSHFGMRYMPALLAVLIFAILLFGEVLFSHAKLPYEQISICLTGGLLIPFFLSALVRVHSGEEGRFLVLIPFVLAFLPDSGAYFVGRFFGKHKLAPVISPNKTVEGMIGGVLAGIAGMIIFGLVMQFGFGFRVNYLYAVLYGAVGALGAVIGDLSFSAIKRQTGIKDYGNLIPGHGGILDRFDSMTIVAPLTEALLLLLPVMER